MHSPGDATAANHSNVPDGRREDVRLLRGEGRFVGDLNPPGMLHAVFVRSAHAHGRLRGVDMVAARALPGVVAVFAAADLPGLVMPPVNALLPITPLSGTPLPGTPLPGTPFAQGNVLAVGAPLALVVAHTLAAAQAAADLVWADIDELPAQPDHATDAAPVASVRYAQGTLPTTPPTASVRIAAPRLAPCPLEPRAALLHWQGVEQAGEKAGEHAGEAPRLQAWLSTQTPERARQMLAASLNMPPAQVHVVAPDVGGAFGGKAAIGPEELVLAHAARHLGAPLRWQATRMEDFASAPHGRASQAQGAIWLNADGDITAIDAQFHFSLGHWLTYSAVVPARNAARIVPGPYRVAAVQAQAHCTASHAAAVGIYRGAGRPEAAILLERLVDEAARQTGQCPLALRRRQLWPAAALPAALPGGDRLDAMDLPGLLDRAEALFGYAAWRARQQRQRAAGALLGIGIGLYVEPCGQGSESATLTALGGADVGRYLLATGATAQGQGRETAYARIAAPVLGCAEWQITVLHGDTATCPPGIGALASRSTAIGGSAVLLAARQLRAELDAGATVPHRVAVTFTATHEAWAAGCVMTAVQIDRATGELQVLDLAWVDDAGVAVHPTLLRGQLLGGLAQGIGAALMERIVYDDQGQLLTGSLMDYALPRAADVPPVRLASHHTPSAANPLGAKGVGEAGCIGVPAALLNAVDDALAPLGRRAPDFPLSAARLWQVLQDDPACSTNR